MIHNLAIADYAIGHTGSAHDAYAFRSTHIYHHHATLLGDNHWIWADSAYPLEPWCIPPFKKPVNGALTSDQKAFNTALSRVCVLFYFSLCPFIFGDLGSCPGRACICCSQKSLSVSSRTSTPVAA